MLIKLLFAILLAFSVTVMGHYYLFVRLISPLFGNSPFWVMTFFCLWSLTFFGFLILRIVPHFLRKIFEVFMFLWMGVAFLFLIVCLITSPISLFLKFMNYDDRYLTYFVILSGLFLTFYSMRKALKAPSVIEARIPITKSLPESLKKLRIIVISDIHVSGLIGRKRMIKLTKKINSLSPDIIFITGDLMDGSVKQLKKEVAPLAELRSKQGVIYITGNHEYYSGPKSWKQHLSERFHWHVISNASHSFKFEDLNINILGIEDRHWLSHEKIPRRNDRRLHSAVYHLQRNGYEVDNSLNILLAHQPKDSKFMLDFPFIDLQISGHTHGGQIWPLEYIVLKDQKYNKGLYKINANQHIYVNQGTGFWGPPMRLGTVCEITLMTFYPSQDN
ncbi:metallophosphoesterase [Fluviispira vulneris]|uniref:metallophosphoesterase n=1 Tax=Fluviispira vulneris TaxID=2763012 RepID=UPI001645B20C|nr:metallophosphoesterase [Fluviispira vulneris]